MFIILPYNFQVKFLSVMFRPFANYSMVASFPDDPSRFPSSSIHFLLQSPHTLLSELFAVFVQSLSHVQLFVTPWNAEIQASLFTISQSLLKLMSIKSVMPSNRLILCHPLLLLPPIFSSIRVFSNELALRIRWLKYWSFSIRPSSEYSALISFKIDWFDLLAVWRINAFQPALVSTNNRIWQKQWYITSKTKLWKSLWLLSWSFCVCVCFPKSFFLSHITCSRKSQLPQHGQYKGQVHLSRNWGHVSDLGGRYLQPQPWWL